MQYEDLMIIGVFVLQVVLLAWQLNQKKGAIVDDLSEVLAGLIEDLDGRLAEALQSVMTNLGQNPNFEPPNPFQTLIAQYLQMKMTENVPGAKILIPKDEKGKFTSPEVDIPDSD
tara:strand:+ start:107 stop:451 length:345 start_codon:yes stop_codon:yes gene_type:complete